MKKLMLPIAFAAISLIGFLSYSAFSSKALHSQGYCYASIICADTKILSCKVDGPSCSIKLDENSIRCQGFVDDNENKTINKKCKEQ